MKNFKNYFLKNLFLISSLILSSSLVAQNNYSKSKLKKIKSEVVSTVGENHKLTQVMVDKIFSFAELGFHEVESSKYLTSILKSNSFEIEYGVIGFK